MKSVIIITGASSGMGVCFAEQLSQESALARKSGLKNVVPSDEMWLIARRTEKLQQVKENIELEAKKAGLDSFYPEIKLFSVDISGREGAYKVKELIDQQNKAENIQINILVNNAGFGTYGEFANTDVNRQMEMVDLDCTSLTGITGYALPLMKKGSRIINTASLASYAPLGNFAVYGACKAYVLSFSIALRAELKPKGIKVTALCPGSVSTEFANVASNGARKEVLHGLSPVKTVKDAVKKSRKGKAVSMYAFKWKVKAFFSRVVSPKIVAWATYKYDKRPSNPL